MHVVDADNEKESLLGDEGCDNAAKTARTASCPARAKSWFQRSRLLAALDIFLLLAIAYYIFAPDKPGRSVRVVGTSGGGRLLNSSCCLPFASYDAFPLSDT